jgi:hypothetical protein
MTREHHDVAVDDRLVSPTGVTASIWSGWMWPTLPGLCPMITSSVPTRAPA